MFFNIEHYLHISRKVIGKMTKDQYLVATREAAFVRDGQMKNYEISMHNAIAKIINEMFGDSKSSK